MNPEFDLAPRAEEASYLTWLATGPDPAVDELLSVEIAVERGEELERLRFSLEHGSVDPEIARAVQEAIGGRPCLCAAPQEALRWLNLLRGRTLEHPPLLVGLSAVRAVLFPSADAPTPPWLDAEPSLSALDGRGLSASALREAFLALLAAHHCRPRPLRRFVLACLRRTAEGFRLEGDPGAAALFLLAARLSEAEDEDPGEILPHPATLYSRLTPRFAEDLDLLLEEDALPRVRPMHESAAVSTEDRHRIQRVFREALPRSLSDPHAYRPSQARLAEQVLETLEARRFLLVDAPTGTGKTLAYLTAVLPWACANDVRCAVSTYTRTLQDQAYYRELPRALALLRVEGFAGNPRLALLKGRANYVCSRMLAPLAPEPGDLPEDHLAWFLLALFALTDPTGDFDRLPPRPPLPVEGEARVLAAIRRLRQECSGETRCCQSRADRARCAAEVARRRAERAHVVITNHAFVLADASFFGHVIFDECDHLHAQTHSIVSFDLPRQDLVTLGLRLLGRGHVAGVLGQLATLFPIELDALFVDPIARSVENARDAVQLLEPALLSLDDALRLFLRWRAGRERERRNEERHQFLQEFARIEPGEVLLAAHEELLDAIRAIAVALGGLRNDLTDNRERRVQRLTRHLARELVRLEDHAELLARWLPREEGGPRFDPAFFYDVEVEGQPASWRLVMRIILPHVYLGTHYLPRLASGVLLSASTYLRGGFAKMQGYLGLDLLAKERAAAPDESEPDEDERIAREVLTHRAEPVFDYRRVLVAVPKDAPLYGNDGTAKARFLDFAVSYIAELAERGGGRTLGLFTNSQDLRDCGRRLQNSLRARGLVCYWQNMPGFHKEELPERFRSSERAVLLGVDTFWYGVDFPGEDLEQVVIVKLPYGALDRFMQAQIAAMGRNEQYSKIYLTQALAMFRQGFGRLLRTRADKGAVHVLDRRILDPRHRQFLRELPGFDEEGNLNRPQFYTGPRAVCLEKALLASGRYEERREPPEFVDSADEVPW